ncbi:hypothetical protein D3C83_162730 [compost metagenome]
MVKVSGSEPPAGSLIEKAETISLLSSGSRYLAFCDLVPKWAMISALPVSGAWQPNTEGAKCERPRISFIRPSLTCP